MHSRMGAFHSAIWTSNAGFERGTIVTLKRDWRSSATPVSVDPWEGMSLDCDGHAPVWCVEDWTHFAFSLSTLLVCN